jgi:hypothetical protein
MAQAGLEPKDSCHTPRRGRDSYTIRPPDDWFSPVDASQKNPSKTSQKMMLEVSQLMIVPNDIH